MPEGPGQWLQLGLQPAILPQKPGHDPNLRGLCGPVRLRTTTQAARPFPDVTNWPVRFRLLE